MQPTPVEDIAAPALPCAGGLIAGTLALMTCWAAPEAAAPVSAQHQRALMARKIVSNLYFLREHPDLAPGLRQVIGKVHQRWLLLAQALPPAAEPHPDPLRAANALH
jgi:hypothetical protein